MVGVPVDVTDTFNVGACVEVFIVVISATGVVLFVLDSTPINGVMVGTGVNN